MPLVVVRARLGNLLFRHMHVVVGLQNIGDNGRFDFGIVHAFLLWGGALLWGGLDELAAARVFRKTGTVWETAVSPRT
jgi:hypothetical protein